MMIAYIQISHREFHKIIFVSFNYNPPAVKGSWTGLDLDKSWDGLQGISSMYHLHFNENRVFLLNIFSKVFLLDMLIGFLQHLNTWCLKPVTMIFVGPRCFFLGRLWLLSVRFRSSSLESLMWYWTPLWGLAPPLCLTHLL